MPDISPDAMTGLTQEQPVTVYFDGSCPLCRAEIGVYQRTNGAERVRFCDVSQPGTVPPDLTPETAMARFHVRGRDGVLQDGARGFILLWQSLARWRWLGRLAAVPPLPWLLERAYRGFLVIRPFVQRQVRRRAG
jgi:predicted DCC family thiol-disulfide oxidoreductase YuxK